MEDIDKRLRESTDACIKSFENWVKQNKTPESREGLMEALHEVRKVVARVEIEIAISERDRLGSRPLPIPPHRSQRKSSNGEEGDFADFADDAVEQPSRPQGEGRRQHGGGGRGRRPMHGRGNRDNSGSDDNSGNTSEGQPS